MAKKTSPKKATATDKQDARSSPLKELKQNDDDATKDGQRGDQSQPNHDDQSKAANVSMKQADTQDEATVENKKKRKTTCSTIKGHAVDNDDGEERSEPAAETSIENNEADSQQDAAPPSDDSDGKPSIDLTKPIKKARTAYFIFSDERRAEIQAKVGYATLSRRDDNLT
jgi:hypothetical protein